MATDPICGMEVAEHPNLGAEQFGKRYYFCSAHCLSTFLKKSKFAKHLASPPLAGSPSGTTSACCQTGPVPKREESGCCQKGLVPKNEESSCCQKGPAPQKEESGCCQKGPVPKREESGCCQTGPVPQKEESSCCEEGPVPQKEESSCCQKGPVPKREESSCCHGHGGEAVKPSAGAAFFCPMCPGVESETPADCPICGMALIPNPRFASASQGPIGAKEWQEFLGAALLSLPVFVLAMLHLFPSIAAADWYHAPWVAWTQAILTTAVLAFHGRSIFTRGWRAFTSGHHNMWSLISVGVGAAFLYSWFALAKASLQSSHHGPHGLELYFESAAVIVTFVLLGQYLEARAQSKTGAALQALLDLSPSQALRLTDQGEAWVDTSTLTLGDRVRVQAGQKVPVDGVVLEGSGALDEALLTGESLPVSKAPGDAVTGGTLNLQGSFVMQCQRVGEETVLQQMIQAVAEAQHSRAPIQSVADRVAAVFVPTVFVISILTFLLWGIFGAENGWKQGFEHAVAVLVIACPCALGLATPLSVMVGIGRAAREGVLIRSAEALERLEKVNTVVFDKTGTLTEGRAVHRATRLYDTEFSEAQALAVAAALEKGSNHPLAYAMVRAAASQNLSLPEVHDFAQRQAAGVEGWIDAQHLRVGSLAFLKREGVEVSAAESEPVDPNFSPIYLSLERRLIARFDFQDPLKAQAQPTLASLKANGFASYLLSGDRAASVDAVSATLPLTGHASEQTPATKREFVERLQREDSAVVAMIGDGVNDAIALSVADVGIAVSDGSDVAKQTASVTLLRGDLSRVQVALDTGKRTMKNIRQNLFFAFLYNALGIPLAAGLLMPFFGWKLTPMIAGLAMSFSSLSVILNSLRLGWPSSRENDPKS